ncbi:YeeE/YedE family protein [Sphingomonas sp. WKB10]|nr:YeeE/YedE family protein [Sphingomonas sp. WKB10]
MATRLLAGLVMAGVGATALGAMRGAAAIDAMSLPLLIGGGLLVGFGAGFGGGCTSGHGVCGIARLSPRSLVAVPVFMLSAILTVLMTK